MARQIFLKKHTVSTKERTNNVNEDTAKINWVCCEYELIISDCILKKLESVEFW